MIKIKYDNGKFNMHTESNITEIMGCFSALLDTIEKDYVLKFAFEMAKNYRKDRDAKNNSDN